YLTVSTLSLHYALPIFGVHVHLDDAVGQRLLDLALGRAGAAVEYEVEGQVALLQPQLLDSDVLAHLEDLRLELDVARLVDAVDVAEGGGQQVARPGVAGAQDRKSTRLNTSHI